MLFTGFKHHILVASIAKYYAKYLDILVINENEVNWNAISLGAKYSVVNNPREKIQQLKGFKIAHNLDSPKFNRLLK
jgi:hypothetical protein